MLEGKESAIQDKARDVKIQPAPNSKAMEMLIKIGIPIVETDAVITKGIWSRCQAMVHSVEAVSCSGP